MGWKARRRTMGWQDIEYAWAARNESSSPNLLRSMWFGAMWANHANISSSRPGDIFHSYKVIRAKFKINIYRGPEYNSKFNVIKMLMILPFSGHAQIKITKSPLPSTGSPSPPALFLTNKLTQKSVLGHMASSKRNIQIYWLTMQGSLPVLGRPKSCYRAAFTIFTCRHSIKIGWQKVSENKRQLECSPDVLRYVYLWSLVLSIATGVWQLFKQRVFVCLPRLVIIRPVISGNMIIPICAQYYVFAYTAARRNMPASRMIYHPI